MRSLFSISLLLCFLICTSSCTDEVRPLSKTDLNAIDTLYLNQTKSMKTELDSLCKVEYKKTYQGALDSIKAVRLKEIKSILGK